MYDRRCRCCGAPEARTFFEVESVPVHSNLLFDSSEEALGQASGHLALAFCDGCGFVQNSAFDPDLVDYAAGYEDAQGHSPRFQVFADELVSHLTKTYALQGKRILEIGCAQGAFLRQLCEAGGNDGVGFDPAYRGPAKEMLESGSIEFHPEFYDERHDGLAVDFVFVRHTLEHVGDVSIFVRTLARNLSAGVPVYLEVPEAQRILDETAFWDVYYEHAAYFTEQALCGLLERNGFEIRASDVGYDGQYLMVEAISGANASRSDRLEGRPTSDAAAGGAARFDLEMSRLRDSWKQRLADWRAEGKSVVLWGAGSKAVGFVNAIGVGSLVDAIVDVNPAKQGSFQAGTGHRIVAPEDLPGIDPGAVIVMNPVYLGEISDSLTELGLEPHLCAL